MTYTKFNLHEFNKIIFLYNIFLDRYKKYIFYSPLNNILVSVFDKQFNLDFY